MVIAVYTAYSGDQYYVDPFLFTPLIVLREVRLHREFQPGLKFTNDTVVTEFNSLVSQVEGGRGVVKVLFLNLVFTLFSKSPVDILRYSTENICRVLCIEK